MHKALLLSFLSFWLDVSWAGITLSMPDAVGLKANSTVTWKRASGDPIHFFLQSILFSTSLQPPGLASAEITVLDSQLEGTATIISSFAGPHIIVALDPSNPFPLLATSNAFQVGVGGTTSGSLPSSPSVPSVSTVTQTVSSTSAPAPSKSETPTIIAAVLGTLGGCALLACIGLCIYQRRRRLAETNMSELRHGVQTSSESGAPPAGPWSGSRRNTNMHIEPFVGRAPTVMADTPYGTSLPSAHPTSESSQSRGVTERLNALEQAMLSSDRKSRPARSVGWSSSEEPVSNRPPSYTTDRA